MRHIMTLNKMGINKKDKKNETKGKNSHEIIAYLGSRLIMSYNGFSI